MRRTTLVAVLVGTLVGCGTQPDPTETLAAASALTFASASPSEVPTPTATLAPTGASVDIGGRSLWMECQGSGSPAVILESGMAGDHRTWERIQPALAETTRVCTYDRAGIALSDPAPTPRTAQDAVDDLHSLLAAGAIEPPYVLVGFSWGGLLTQLYASTYADEIAGLVLVESNHPLEADQFEAQLTPDQIAADRAELLANPEGFDPYASFEEVQAAGDLPRVPLVVVTAGISEGWPSDWDAELFDALRAEQQADLATLVPGGRQVTAENSAHHVPGQAPGVIIEAIESVLADGQ